MKFKTLGKLGLVFLAIGILSHPAWAANTSGGGLPYESWLQKIVNSITGPFAYAVSIIGMVGAGAGLIFGGSDMNGFLRTLLWLVLVFSLIVAGKNTLSVITGQGAEITIVNKVNSLKRMW